MTPPLQPYSPEEGFARHLDERDPLARFRDRFNLPQHDGEPALYLCGHSLGPQPRDAAKLVEEALREWAARGVEGHFQGPAPWYDYHRRVADPLARLAGALPSEVVAMNSLTVNLHLMMVSFYRPTPGRHAVLMEDSAFPSDTYAVRSQIACHGHDPDEALRIARPRKGEETLRPEDLEERLEREGGDIALVLLGGVNYFTGQAFDLERLTAAAHRQGCLVGLDLAHGMGNLPLHLHDWGVDFAVWCSYKYLNAGPGAVAGAFVHQRHGDDPSRPRFAGWWGNDPATRFRMHLQPEFVPQPGAEGWQVSNPPILALAPLRASLALFDEARIEALRAKSLALTGYLEFLVDRLPAGFCTCLTPRDPARRGCQLSLRFPGASAEMLQALATKGVVADFRPPDVLRVAPIPLYNRFHEVWRFASLLHEAAAGGGR